MADLRPPGIGVSALEIFALTLKPDPSAWAHSEPRRVKPAPYVHPIPKLRGTLRNQPCPECRRKLKRCVCGTGGRHA